MAKIVAYLSCPGKTREVMTFYKECLGGELEIMEVKDTSSCESMPKDMQGQIMHSSLTNGNLQLMCTDMQGPEGVTVGSNVSLMLDCDNEAQIRDWYAKLSDGGSANSPVSPAFWGGLFGHLTDKFGVNWLLNCTNP